MSKMLRLIWNDDDGDKKSIKDKGLFTEMWNISPINYCTAYVEV